MDTPSLPPHHLDICLPDRREPGMMVFNVRPGGSADLSGNVGWILGVDQTGDFALNLPFDKPSQDNRVLSNGNLIFSLTSTGLIMEVTRRGELVRQWHIAGKWVGKTPPEGSAEIDLALTHHTINLFPNDNLLLLTAEMRQFENWPTSDSDPNAPTHTANVIGDVICEVGQDGTILRQWKLLDMLDPYRLSYGSCSGYWNDRGFTDSNDWCHTNAVTYDPRDDSIIASLRTQDCIIKFDCATSEIKWILGDHGNWKAPWSDKLLTPAEGLEWQYHQHDCSVTPSGTILCFDNGNNRSTPFTDRLSPAESYSRVVEFEVDEEAMTVRQVWAYGKDPGERLFACYQGGAYRLPETGNTFMTYGGIVTADGQPSASAGEGFARARLLEVTPDKEIVFDLWIDDSDTPNGMSLSSFRSQHVPPQ